MNRDELKTRLEQVGVDPTTYSLGGGLPSERYVLNQAQSQRWEVYYSERGEKSSLRIFDSESDATQYFLERILADPTVSRIRSSDS